MGLGPIGVSLLVLARESEPKGKYIDGTGVDKGV
jgi:hypothetical protein